MRTIPTPLPLLGITDPSSCTLPAAPKELLARVNTPMSSPSACDQQHDKEIWGSWNGDSKGYGDTFGDCIPKKEKNVLRIGFQNIGGFTINKGKYKERIIRKGIAKWELDIIGCAETNVDWRIVPEEDRLYFRTKEW